MRVGIVISNHGAEPETEKKMKEQFKLDEVLYFKHPDIDPRFTKEQVWEMAGKFLQEEVAKRIWALADNDIEKALERTPVVAIINGEYGFSTACVSLLQQEPKIPCYYPTTERGATEELQKDNSIKTTHIYKFVQFRDW